MCVSVKPSKYPLHLLYFSGAIIVPSIAVGQVVGGMIPKFFNLHMKGLLAQCTINSIVGAFFSAGVLLRCASSPTTGVTLPYSDM